MAEYTHTDAPDGAALMAEHLKECAQVDAAIVVDGNADPVIATLLADGWTWDERPTERLLGKRVRYLKAPS